MYHYCHLEVEVQVPQVPLSRDESPGSLHGLVLLYLGCLLVISQAQKSRLEYTGHRSREPSVARSFTNLQYESTQKFGVVAGEWGTGPKDKFFVSFLNTAGDVVCLHCENICVGEEGKVRLWRLHVNEWLGRYILDPLISAFIFTIGIKDFWDRKRV